LSPYRKKSQDLVSVIIINFNYGKYLEEAIRSALDQTYPNLEVIVVNNGSTDQSSEVLGIFGNAINIIHLPTNLGQALARNIGVKHSRGKFLCFLDADDYWEKSKVAEQVKIVCSQSQLVYCGVREFGLVQSKYLKPKYAGDCSSFFLNPVMEAVVLGGESTALMTRNLYDQVGGFRKEMNRASGWDFFRRCSLFTSFAYTEEALTNYRRHPLSASTYFFEAMIDRQRAYKATISEDVDTSRPRKMILLFNFFRICLKAILFHFLSLLLRKENGANRDDINLRTFLSQSVKIWAT
jgi:glycosyltransferase involved in cell wall biosynthesis